MDKASGLHTWLPSQLSIGISILPATPIVSALMQHLKTSSTLVGRLIFAVAGPKASVLYEQFSVRKCLKFHYSLGKPKLKLKPCRSLYQIQYKPYRRTRLSLVLKLVDNALNQLVEIFYGIPLHMKEKCTRVGKK